MKTIQRTSSKRGLTFLMTGNDTIPRKTSFGLALAWVPIIKLQNYIVKHGISILGIISFCCI